MKEVKEKKSIVCFIRRIIGKNLISGTFMCLLKNLETFE